MQQINVIRTNEILGHVDNGSLEGSFAMMIGCDLANVSGQLCHFDL